MRRIAKWAVFIAIILLVVRGLFLWFEITGLLALDQTRRGWTFPSTVYSDWLIVRVGEPMSLDWIANYLKKAGYEPTPSPDHPGPGTYRRQGDLLLVHTRPFFSPSRSEAYEGERFLRVKGSFSIGRIEISPDGHSWSRAEAARLEPIPIARFYDQSTENREFILPERIPPMLKNAVVSVEDRRFFTHGAWDIRAIGRAAWDDLRTGRLVEGGSTLTQQIAKNIFLTKKKTLWRKLLELGVAEMIELRYRKPEILGIYLNQVYLGQDGPVSVSGVATGARYYFGKSVSSLTLPECATLAGMIRSPLLYSPLADPMRTFLRRNFVLDHMVMEGFISREEAASAKAKPLGLSMFRSARRTAGPYFVDHVRTLLLDRYSPMALTSQGMKIFTTFDPFLQEAAEKSLAGSSHETAVVVLDPATGFVRALVGGRNHATSQFNRATQARRQPGSAFKPFVYGAALDRWRSSGASWTLASLLYDSTFTATIPGQEELWKPRNYDNFFRGRVTVAISLEDSLNVPTARLTQAISPDAAAAFAQKMGIESPLKAVLSIGLGTNEVSLLELCSAYTPFAAAGWRAQPLLIKSVTGHDGSILEENASRRESVLDPATAYLVTWALNQALIQGTGRAALALGMTGGFAGKTGTTEQGRDAWFIGYSPDILCGVWVGDDQPHASGLSGPGNALPHWLRFMQIAGLDHRPRPFSIPPEIQFRKVDENSGLLARSGCPEVVTMPFAGATAPTAYCMEHPGGVIGLLKRWFGAVPTPLHHPPVP